MAEEHSTIDQLIINGPYDEPQEYWRYDRESRSFFAAAGAPLGGIPEGVREFKGFR